MGCRCDCAASVGHREVLDQDRAKPDPRDRGGGGGQLLQQDLGTEEQPQQDDRAALPRRPVLALRPRPPQLRGGLQVAAARSHTRRIGRDTRRGMSLCCGQCGVCPWRNVSSSLTKMCREKVCAECFKKLHPNCIRRFVITEKAPTRAFSWLKAATTAFTF